MAEPLKRPTHEDYRLSPQRVRYLNRMSIIVGWLFVLIALVMWFALKN